MCDEFTSRDEEAFLKARGLTRRQFTAASAGTALALMLPPVANALDVVESNVTISTPDGEADAFFVHPVTGAHAAVMVWPDVKGIRPAFRAMGKRLAQSGYAVLVVNPYYRTHKGDLVEPGDQFSDPAVREKVLVHARTLSPETSVSDGRALAAWLDQQPQVDTDRKMGVTGYCMTGSYTMRLAAAMPERIGAGGSFHGGGLATDKPDSPHLLAPQMQAGFLIAVAENDDERNPDEKEKLREAFEAAGVDAEIEVYAGTRHGWCPPDSAVYDEQQADRAWARLLVLFERELA